MEPAPRRDRRWHVRRRLERVVTMHNGVPVIGLGRAQAWDYGDLVRLRETATRLLAEGHRSIGIDMSRILYLPSGFMNMLCEWTDREIHVFLYHPEENVREMVWFGEFMERAGDGAFRVINSEERDPLRYNDREDSESGDDIPVFGFSL